MSIENQVEKEVLKDTNSTPERGNVVEKDMFDSMGKPRMTREMPNGDLIWASEVEFAEAVQAFNNGKN